MAEERSKRFATILRKAPGFRGSFKASVNRNRVILPSQIESTLSEFNSWCGYKGKKVIILAHPSCEIFSYLSEFFLRNHSLTKKALEEAGKSIYGAQKEEMLKIVPFPLYSSLEKILRSSPNNLTTKSLSASSYDTNVDGQRRIVFPAMEGINRLHDGSSIYFVGAGSIINIYRELPEWCK